MDRKINWQRSFKIPRFELDKFLQEIQRWNGADGTSYEARYIFELGNHYNVVVIETGPPYPFCRSQIEDKAKKLLAE